MVLTNLPQHYSAPHGGKAFSEEGVFGESVIHLAGSPTLRARALLLGLMAPLPCSGRASRLRLGTALLLGFPRHLLQQLALRLMINSLPENEAGVS